MNQDEYDRKYRQAPGTVKPDGDRTVEIDGLMPPIEDEKESRRQLDEAGYDYEGAEEWIAFWKKMGRL